MGPSYCLLVDRGGGTVKKVERKVVMTNLQSVVSSESVRTGGEV